MRAELPHKRFLDRKVPTDQNKHGFVSQVLAFGYKQGMIILRLVFKRSLVGLVCYPSHDLISLDPRLQPERDRRKDIVANFCDKLKPFSTASISEEPLRLSITIARLLLI